MTLRDLLKKAKNDPNNDEGYAQMFDEALHNCAEELLNVVEAAEGYTEHGYFMGGPPVQDDYDQLCAALLRYREKEGKV